MKNYFLLLLLVASLCANSQRIAIENVNIIDVRKGEIIGNQHVLIEKDLIKDIASSRFNQVDQRINASGKFLIPGLWDMHVHLSMVGEESIPLFVLNGVTGVRDMGGNWNQLKEWRDYSNKSGQNIYPVIRTAGPILESPQFYGILSKILGPEFSQTRIPVNDINDVYSIIDSLSSLGVDFVKIRTAASEDAFMRVLESTRKNGLQVTGHIDQNINIQKAVENGISTIEHDLFLQILSMEEDQKKSTIEAIRRNQPYFSPTLIATFQSRLRSKEDLTRLIYDSTNQYEERRKYVSPVLLENWSIGNEISRLEAPMPWDSIVKVSRSFARRIAGATKVLSGTDVGVAGIYPGWSLHEELKMMVAELGISPIEALQSSTINAAESLGLLNQYGTVEKGKKADLILLGANAMEDIANTHNIEIVFKNGVPITIDAREERLLEIANDINRSIPSFEANNLEYLKTILKQMGL